ncbi:hypothetical protein J6590_026735 [Homalodisca vitripennis]|nr:hypothetical protein J6590_026735 [Homalodisca vitripennis]
MMGSLYSSSVMRDEHYQSSESEEQARLDSWLILEMRSIIASTTPLGDHVTLETATLDTPTCTRYCAPDPTDEINHRLNNTTRRPQMRSIIASTTPLGDHVTLETATLDTSTCTRYCAPDPRDEINHRLNNTTRRPHTVRLILEMRSIIASTTPLGDHVTLETATLDTPTCTRYCAPDPRDEINHRLDNTTRRPHTVRLILEMRSIIASTTPLGDHVTLETATLDTSTCTRYCAPDPRDEINHRLNNTTRRPHTVRLILEMRSIIASTTPLGDHVTLETATLDTPTCTRYCAPDSRDEINHRLDNTTRRPRDTRDSDTRYTDLY